MIGVVVPIHNQKNNIKRVVEGYLRQSMIPNYIVFVLDRCTDGSKHALSEYATEFLNLGCELILLEKPETISGFSAGATRDFGIRWLLENTQVDCFVFTDGDCIPHPQLVLRHFEVVTSESTPTVSCGARVDTEEDGSFTPDTRLTRDYTQDLVFSNLTSRLVINPRVVENSWACWSCNMALNKSALELCLDVNFSLTGCKRVFNQQFDGKWGGEDGFVALIVFRCGGNVVMLDPSVTVTHIWHPRGHTNDSHLYVVDAVDTRLRNLLHTNPPKQALGSCSEFTSLLIPRVKTYDDVESLRRIESFSVPDYIYTYVAQFSGVQRNAAAWFLSRNVKHVSKFSESEMLTPEEGQAMYESIVETLRSLETMVVEYPRVAVETTQNTELDGN